MHQFLEKGRWKQSGLHLICTTTPIGLKRQIHGVKYQNIGHLVLLYYQQTQIRFSFLCCPVLFRQKTRKAEVGRTSAFFYFFPSAKQNKQTKKSSFHLGSTSKQANLVQIKSFHMHVSTSVQKSWTFEEQISGFNSEWNKYLPNIMFFILKYSKVLCKYWLNSAFFSVFGTPWLQ